MVNLTGGDVHKVARARRRLLCLNIRTDKRLTRHDGARTAAGEACIELDTGELFTGPADVLAEYAAQWQALGGESE